MKIVAENLIYTYNRKTKFATRALDEVSLTIDEGEFFGVIGHTGSGKSTFVQHLNGLLPVESGRLTVGDYDLSGGKKTDKKKLRELRSKVGMVFQYPEYQLFADTVFHDVAFAYRNFFAGATDKEVADAVYGAMERVGLDPALANESPFELSGGQKRRAAIAGVLVASPEVLVLDEPLAGLDPAGKNELMTLLHDLHRSVAKTVVIVSHDMDVMADHCTRVAVFTEGKVSAAGTPKEVFSDRARMTEWRLDVPVTAYLTDGLSAAGISADNDYSMDGFVAKIAALYAAKRR